jgi:hypothetical protein
MFAVIFPTTNLQQYNLACSALRHFVPCEDIQSMHTHALNDLKPG